MCAQNSQNEEYAERLKMESDTGERVIFLSTPGPGVWGRLPYKSDGDARHLA